MQPFADGYVDATQLPSAPTAWQQQQQSTPHDASQVPNTWLDPMAHATMQYPAQQFASMQPTAGMFFPASQYPPSSTNYGVPATPYPMNQFGAMPNPSAAPHYYSTSSISIEEQLLEYFKSSLNSESRLSDIFVQQLIAAACPRSLRLDIRTDDEDEWPLLHLVVMNEATPAPDLENIVARLILHGAAPEAADRDGDSSLSALLSLANEHQEDNDKIEEAVLAAQLGVIVALLQSETLTVGKKDVKEVCGWLRNFASGKDEERQRVLDALSKKAGDDEVTIMWSSEELLAYLDTEAYDNKHTIEAHRVQEYLRRGALPRHSQNGATTLLMIVLNPYNDWEELLQVFGAVLEKDPDCAAVADGFKLLPVQWAADYRNVASQHELTRPNPASLLALLPKIVEKLPATVDAGEVCLKTFPAGARRAAECKISRPELRFKEGDRVMCRIQIPGGMCEWEEGVIVDIWYREECWPDNHPGAPYEVKLDIGSHVFALVDHDRIIRNTIDKQSKRNLGDSSKRPRAGRFQKRQKDDGSWELFDTKTGKGKPISPPDSDDSES